MEKLLANSKPGHVICFCKFVEIIHNPIMWPKGQTCIKYMRPLLSWGRQKEEMLNAGALELWESRQV